jgi:hypothetical protein
MEDTARRFLRRRRRQGLGDVCAVLLVVSMKRLAKQRLLVAESRIKAGPVDPHGLGEIGQGGRLVPLAPKNFQGLVQRLVGVESPWAATSCANGRGQFHTNQYNNPFDRTCPAE